MKFKPGETIRLIKSVGVADVGSLAKVVNFPSKEKFFTDIGEVGVDVVWIKEIKSPDSKNYSLSQNNGGYFARDFEFSFSDCNVDLNIINALISSFDEI